MTRKWLPVLGGLALLAAFVLPGFAQESAVKGNLAGTVYDTSGAVVPGAKVTITGPTGSRSINSDELGNFTFPLLIPGFYTVRIEKQGFKVYEIKNVEVFTGRTSTIRATLGTGPVTQVVEVSAAAVAVDTTSTAIGANLADTFYNQIPIGRRVNDLFYLSPGVASGGLSGAANPSISGGSGLENLYVADGVNITDASFGGLGVFSRVYGSLATGINLSFIKEVQVKTGGYEPQYGKATGGIVQIVTKSGSRDYHGAIAGYFGPQQFEAERKHPDDFRFNKTGKTLHQQNYDASAEVGGYIPRLRDKLFFFGSVNPSFGYEFDRFEVFPNVPNPPAVTVRTNTLNYAFKLTYKLNDKHTIESSVFGDPSHTSTGPNNTLSISNLSANSKLEYGTRNWAFRWNGAFSPTWLVNASFTWGFNDFKEKNFLDVYQIADRTQVGLTRLNAPLPAAQAALQRGDYRMQGLGFFEPTESNTFGFNVDTTKEYRFGGKHSFNIGYRLERPFYDGQRQRSGPRFVIPALNASGTSAGIDPAAVGQLSNAAFSLRLASSSCTLCPFLDVPGQIGTGPGGAVRVFLRQDRGEFGPPLFSTSGTYHAIYAIDSWSPNKYVTLNLGLRWEQQQLKGESIKYTFVDNWSPRLGVSVDPWGDRKTKISASFGRYNYAIPLDLAERSLSNELDFLAARWAPGFTVDSSGNRIATINQFGSVTPVLDSSHLLSNATGGTGGSPGVSFQSTEGIARGTKMEYEDEFVVGFEREIKGGVIVSARYLDRRMKRIVEDMSGIPPEAFFAGLNQIYLIGNVSKNLDLFSNPIGHVYASGATPPAACGGASAPFVQDPVEDTFGNNLGAVCYEPTAANGQLPGTDAPDGIPDGFVDPVREYKAVEIEVNKSFSHNWQLRANWRIAKLFGNFEGAFRNDNGQTDPSISSLFDFTLGQFNLLGDQFKPGVLNTDRRHIVNVYTSYMLDKSRLKGMVLGVGVRFQTGDPINDLKAHPAYLNAGEVPVNGRGALGRNRMNGTVDAHVDYPWKITERMHLRLGMDVFNIANSKRQLRTDQNEDRSFGVGNVDFQKPVGRITGFVRPFYARAMVRLEF